MTDVKEDTVKTIDEKIEYDITSKADHDAGEQVEIKEELYIQEEVVEEWQFTWRASVIGSIFGCLIAASNTYLGLKIGWTFGASLFGAIFSFAVIKPLSRILPLRYGGGYFGPKENVTAQSAATTAGGLSAGFVAGIPALYKLGLMTTPRGDAAALVLFTISAAFYGLFFAVPLRRHFIINQELPFPTPRATAITILSLHDSVRGEQEAMKKAKWMAFWFVFTFIWTIIAYFVPFFDSIHILWWIGYSTGYTNMMDADEMWGWFFKFDWPFFGAGLMVPGSTVWSFFIASVFLYGVISPTLVSNGTFVAAGGFTDKGDTAQSFWLWPGVALMVLSSLTELLVQYESLWRGIKGGALELYNLGKRGVYAFKLHVLRRELSEAQLAHYNQKSPEDDKFKPEELVPDTWWIIGTFLSIIFTCAILGPYFGVKVYQSIVAVILAFILSFVGLQSSGETDINPTGSIGKMTQLVFAGMPADSTKHLQRINLMAGTVSASAASQAVDMVGDLKTGQIVGASPRSQFYAQLFASFPAIGIAVGLFILFADAYPCIVDTNLDVSQCEFGLVAVTAWLNVAKLLTGDSDPLSKGAIIVTAVCAALGVLLPIIRHFFIPKKFHRFVPSVASIGIAMINPQPEIPFSMLLGWLGGKLWKRIRPQAYEDLMYSTAGGMLAGQGIAAILQAVFKLGGVKPNVIVASCMYKDFEYCP